MHFIWKATAKLILHQQRRSGYCNKLFKNISPIILILLLNLYLIRKISTTGQNVSAVISKSTY